MNNKEHEELRSWGKMYFKNIIENAPSNIKFGNEMIIGIRFRKEDGSWTETIPAMTIKKEEL